MERLWVKHNSTVTKYNVLLKAMNEQVKRNTAQVMTRYRYLSTGYKELDILKRTLQQLGDVGLPSDVLYRSTLNKLPMIAAAVGITNLVTPGNAVTRPRDTLYTDLMYTCSIDLGPEYQDIHRWNQLRPLRILHHPSLDIHYISPGDYPKVPGYTVLGIDVPLLAVAYGRWSAIQLRLPVAERAPVRRFMDVMLLNCLPEQINLAIRNRVIAISKGHDMHQNIDSGTVATINVDRLLHKGYKDLLTALGRKRYETLLSQIPLGDQSYYASVPKNQITLRGLYSNWLSNLIYLPWWTIVGQLPHRSTTITRDLRAANRSVRTYGGWKFAHVTHIPEIQRQWELLYKKYK